MGIYVPIYLLLSNWKFVPIEPLLVFVSLQPPPSGSHYFVLYTCAFTVLHWLFSTLIWKENAKL